MALTDAAHEFVAGLLNAALAETGLRRVEFKDDTDWTSDVWKLHGNAFCAVGQLQRATEAAGLRIK